MQHTFQPWKKTRAIIFHTCSCGQWFGSPWWTRRYARLMWRNTHVHG